MMISDAHAFKMNRSHANISSNIYFKNYCIKVTPRSSKEPKKISFKIFGLPAVYGEHFMNRSDRYSPFSIHFNDIILTSDRNLGPLRFDVDTRLQGL